MNRKMWFLIFVVLLAGVNATCFSAEEAVLYTKYNIHVQKQARRDGTPVYKASYANYTDPGAGHIVIPAGSPIVLQKTSRKSFEFLNKRDGTVVTFEFHEPRMEMKVDEYISLITSPHPVSLKKFGPGDQKGIKEGKAHVGMTKESVLAALGYPARHRTPSLESPTWVYWTNRFGTLEVLFDKHGKVKEIKD